MTGLEAFIAAHKVVTVLTLCFAHPGAAGDRGCITKWMAPGPHMTTCRILTAEVRSEPGDRLQCSIRPLDHETAVRLFTVQGVCP